LVQLLMSQLVPLAAVLSGLSANRKVSCLLSLSVIFTM
jgi:hypothetical protein